MDIRLTHVALRVKDPRKTAAFYRSYCDLSILHERFEEVEGVEVLWIGNRETLPGFILVLLQVTPEASPKGSFHHFGFDVPNRERVDQIAARAKDEGILEIEPQYVSQVVGYICAFRDPDGNLIEVSYGQLIDC